MNRAELTSVIVSNFGRSDKTDLIYTQIGLALVELSRRHQFEDLRVEADVAIASGDRYISLPFEAKRVLECRIIDGQNSSELVVYPKESFVRAHPNVQSETAGGHPEHGYIEGRLLHFSPISNGDYSIRLTYIKKTTTPDSDAWVPDITAVDDAIIAYATAGMFRSVQLWAAAKEWDTEFERRTFAAIQSDRDKPARIFIASTESEPSCPTPWLNPMEGLR